MPMPEGKYKFKKNPEKLLELAESGLDHAQELVSLGYAEGLDGLLLLSKEFIKKTLENYPETRAQGIISQFFNTIMERYKDTFPNYKNFLIDNGIPEKYLKQIDSKIPEARSTPHNIISSNYSPDLDQSIPDPLLRTEIQFQQGKDVDPGAALRAYFIDRLVEESTKPYSEFPKSAVADLSKEELNSIHDLLTYIENTEGLQSQSEHKNRIIDSINRENQDRNNLEELKNIPNMRLVNQNLESASKPITEEEIKNHSLSPALNYLNELKRRSLEKFDRDSEDRRKNYLDNINSRFATGGVFNSGKRKELLNKFNEQEERRRSDLNENFINQTPEVMFRARNEGFQNALAQRNLASQNAMNSLNSGISQHQQRRNVVRDISEMNRLSNEKHIDALKTRMGIGQIKTDRLQTRLNEELNRHERRNVYNQNQVAMLGNAVHGHAVPIIHHTMQPLVALGGGGGDFTRNAIGTAATLGGLYQKFNPSTGI